MKCGLELHMQLNCGKLFCNCPNLIIDDEKPDFIIKRKLHAVKGETGEVDIAALKEIEKNKIIKYNYYKKSCCLVDIDEEPPHSINMNAFKSAIEIALLLNMKPVDEFHIMRKLIVDGSNPSGFQRTGLIATNGYINTSLGKVKIETLCLEEDSAKRIDDNVFSLDRLGIPLVEIATAPDIKTPEQAREVAEKIGFMAKFTGKLMRGIGTIRQDVNVSIPQGNRVEIKGVQDLRMMNRFVSLEVERQEKLLLIKDYLKDKKIELSSPKNLIKLFIKTKCNFLKNKTIYGFRLKNGKGLFGKKIQLNKTYGKEVAEHIKIKLGIRGLLHIDELPNYGITQNEVDNVVKELGCLKKDGFILISCEKNLIEKVKDIIIEELNETKKGIRKEVRAPNHSDGTTSYMRPLPGGARMYPETDVPQIRLTNELISNIIQNLSKTPEQKAIELKSMNLNSETVNQLLHSDKLSLFEKVCDKTDYVNQLTANLILENNVDMINEEQLISLFKLLEQEKISKTGFSSIITELINGGDYNKIVKKYELLSTKKLNDYINKIIKDNKNILNNSNSFGVLMKKIIEKVKGKADSGVISRLLKKKLGENF